jgi:1,4-dihydroxy-2-naphthoyl-CoA synthase
MAQAYEDAAELITSQMLAEEALEGVNAFKDKRRPDWSPKQPA